MNLLLPRPVHPSQITIARQHEDVGAEPGDQLGRRIKASCGPERGRTASPDVAGRKIWARAPKVAGLEVARLVPRIGVIGSKGRIAELRPHRKPRAAAYPLIAAVSGGNL